MESGPHRYVEDPRFPTPGVYFEEAAPRHEGAFRTGVPVFLGQALSTTGADFQPHWLTRWEQFTETFGQTGEEGFLGDAVRGFFANDGERCAVVTFPVAVASQGGTSWNVALEKCLKRLERVENVDLVCAPDLPADETQRIELQRMILGHCKVMGDRFAILEPAREANVEQALRNWHVLNLATDGALYYPWLRVSSPPGRLVPPCGHVAGVYARTDGRVGVHKAPANEVVNGVVDVQVQVTDRQHREINAVGVNCVRAFPGRGI